MRIVLDTNVLIAAFAARGVCAELFIHCGRYHELVTSSFILGEFHRVMISKLGFALRETDEYTGLLSRKMEHVVPVRLKRPVCRHREDDNVLATALAGKCDVLVTGDRDLLILDKFRRISIISPAGFWKLEAETLG